MKHLIFLIVFFSSVQCFSQPIVNRAGQANTVQDARLAAQYNLFTPRYLDTTAANIQKGIDTCGAIIFCYVTNSLWYRQCAPKKWVQFGSGSGGSQTWQQTLLVSNGSLLTQNNDIDVAGYDFRFSSADEFGVGADSIVNTINNSNGKFRIYGSGNLLTALYSGNVGIGTASPAYTLDVYGKIGINGAQVVYRPDQTSFTGSLFYGNGGTSLSHTSGSTGQYNTAGGIDALNAVTTGYFNTAWGANALKSLTTGNSNTGVGVNALFSVTSGTENTAVGLNALYSNSTGDFNTGLGYNALLNNTTGQTNTAIGDNSLLANTTGLQNTSIGYRNLQSNTTGYYNTSVAYRGMELNTTGYANTGIGLHNLSTMTTGYYNSALGFYAGNSITTGNNNTFLGTYAGNGGSQKVDAQHSIGIGSYSYTTASRQAAFSDSITRLTFTGISRGVAGYVLADSLGNGQYWVARPNAALNPAISSLTAALADNNITNSGYGQFWTWNALSGSYGLRLINNSTATTGSSILFGSRMHGAHAASGVSTYAGEFLNQHTGTNSINYGILSQATGGTTNYAASFSASGGTNNYALIVPSSGSVGIGTSTPSKVFHTVGTVRMESLGTASTDTTTYKPVGINSSGDIIPMTYWPGGGGSSLTATYVGFGGSGNVLSGSANFVFDSTSTELRIGGVLDQGTYQLQMNGPQIFRYGTNGSYALTIKPSGASDPYTPLIGFQATSVNTTASKIGNDYGGIFRIQSGGGRIDFGDFYSGVSVVSIWDYVYNTAGQVMRVRTASSGNVGLQIDGVASQTGALQQFRNSSGTVLSEFTSNGYLKIGGSSIDASAAFEVSSTTKGFLPPRMTATQAEAISSPAEGLLIYSTNGSGATITSKGWWGYDGSTWVKLN